MGWFSQDSNFSAEELERLETAIDRICVGARDPLLLGVDAAAEEVVVGIKSLFSDSAQELDLDEFKDRRAQDIIKFGSEAALADFFRSEAEGLTSGYPPLMTTDAVVAMFEKMEESSGLGWVAVGPLDIIGEKIFYEDSAQKAHIDEFLQKYNEFINANFVSYREAVRDDEVIDYNGFATIGLDVLEDGKRQITIIPHNLADADMAFSNQPAAITIMVDKNGAVERISNIERGLNLTPGFDFRLRNFIGAEVEEDLSTPQKGDYRFEDPESGVTILLREGKEFLEIDVTDRDPQSGFTSYLNFEADRNLSITGVEYDGKGNRSHGWPGGVEENKDNVPTVGPYSVFKF